jgi:hypothetical protein
MKINELNMFQNMLGKAGQAASAIAQPTNTQGVGSAMARAKKSGLSPEDQLAQDSFVQKFVSRGANALNTAIQQGLVDTTSSDLGTPGGAAGAGQAGAAGAGAGGAGAQPAAAGQTPGAAPAAGGAPASPNAATQARIAAAPNGYDPQTGKPNPAPAAPGAKVKAPGDAAIATGQKQGAAKPEIDVNVDKIVSAMRKLQPAGTKPLPPESKMAKEIAADLGKVSLNKDYLIRVGDKILKANNAGYDVKNLHQQFMGQYAKGNKQKTIQESIGEDRLTEIYHKMHSSEKFRNALKKAGYDPELAVNRIQGLLAKKRKEREDRDRFLKTDEGIMDKIKGVFKRPGQPAAAPAAGAQPAAAGAPAAGTGKPSIGSWLRDNFMKGFLRGISFGSSQQQVDDILKRMPQSYKAGTLNKDLTDIANIAWAVSDQGRKQDK